MTTTAPVTAPAVLDENLIRAARLWVSHHRPYYATALFRCPIIATDAIATFAIDAAWRIWVNPAYANTLPVSRVAAALIHEINHNLRRHGERAHNKHIAPHEQALWNIAGDCEMNDDLRGDGLDVDDAWMYPERFDLAPGLTAEAYFDALRAQIPPQPDGGCGHGEPNCGGGARGYRQDHEDGTSETGLSDADGELLRRNIAHDIANYERAKGRGSVPGGLSRWAEHYLRPQVNWRNIMAGAVRRSLGVTTGNDDYSRSRISRRDDLSVPVVLPGMVRPIPKIAVVVDTSGSMNNHDLALALSEINAILRTIGVSGTEVRVIACDAAVTASKTVFSARQVNLLGGGGTDMTVGIAEAAKHHPTVTVVLTDGETGWGHKPVRAGKVIVGLITRHPEHLLGDIPGWARVVHIDPDR